MIKKIFAVLSLLTGFSVTTFAADPADNSGKNKAQLQNQELDARDQSNSKADVELTAQIRKSVVSQDSFSTNAKNVKIITSGGHVTLKGPVNSADEKNKIREIAVKVAGKAHVNDEIEIVKK